MCQIALDISQSPAAVKVQGLGDLWKVRLSMVNNVHCSGAVPCFWIVVARE